MESAEIARRFLRFFEERGHTVVPSASLVAEDPTLLLVNAGMVPFKPYFLGQQKPPYRRAASAQKVIRTLDIDEVGKTTRHASFFQMLGNFSFGDYFKEDAIPFAWELLTRPESEGGFGFPEDRLWVTVYLDDDEAQDIWHRKAGVPLERIQRRGMADNFWSMGVPGPCGPCSEIYYDRGPEYGVEGGPIADENRYLEVWNNVFMQFERGEGGGKDNFPILGDLPAKSVDTGMGLERMAAILQGVDNIYEIDTTYKILDRAAELTRSRYGRDPRSDVSLRVVADHMRAGVMLVGDGVLPSNEGRGYVLRRMLRRAIRNLRLLGAGEERYMHELTATTIEVMAEQYQQLKADAANIHTVIDAEEASFLGTLRTGTAIFDAAVEETKRKGAPVLSGSQAFQLHDTYGFPIDLTLEMAVEQGLKVDEDGFRRLMKEQRDRAKADAAAKKTGNADISVFGDILEKTGKVDFLGYNTTLAEATVIGVLIDGVAAPAAGAGMTVEIVLDRTPFYAEGGGQLADQGVIRTAGGEIEVVDVQSPVAGVVVHRGKVRAGEVRVGEAVHAEVDVERRRAISRSHTATHLVHRGFRNALGESAAQAGSENSPGRFRFDFTAAGAVPASMLRDVEDEVNAVLINDLKVNAYYTSQAEARKMGALALFGEKYGDEVRVVEVGEYSRELCGGTHVASSGQLGLVKVLGESSIGAGVRRVEALVGIDAFRFLARESVLVAQISEQLKTRREELPERVEGIVSRLRAAEKELDKLRSAQVLAVAGELAAGAPETGGVSVVTHRAPDGTSADDLRKLALDVRGRFPGDRAAVVVVAGVPSDRPVVVAAVNEAGRARGLSAGRLVGVAAKALGGGGGGKDDVAQGGGTRPEAIGDALRAVGDTIAGQVG
ncbi:alanine--tRNA ligase [Sinosporangium siamense]|uniref:Alanine--tRNA ligase n=1 Tax=Sinosporangium siamense TaxID=1367973 RepID=A0A919V7N6_9ACTN|nr:alanine--tRNA ligase [Sinosporangium siamense]GII95310.1 alanine--tRNA ligase [Sinosporangium siamense]